MYSQIVGDTKVYDQICSFCAFSTKTLNSYKVTLMFNSTKSSIRTDEGDIK